MTDPKFLGISGTLENPVNHYVEVFNLIPPSIHPRATKAQGPKPSISNLKPQTSNIKPQTRTPNPQVGKPELLKLEAINSGEGSIDIFVLSDPGAPDGTVQPNPETHCYPS